MNVTEYIASGILESYVMGAVSDQERREVECLSSIYPDIRRELDQLSEVLENYALLHSVEPPESVKAKLLDQLDFDKPATGDHCSAYAGRYGHNNSSPTFRVTWIVAASMGCCCFFFRSSCFRSCEQTRKHWPLLRTDNSRMQSEVRQLRDQKTQTDQTLAVAAPAGYPNAGIERK